MSIAYPPEIFSEVMDFLVTSPSPDDIIAFKPSSKLEMRLTDLLGKKQQDTLTDDEQAELAEFRLGAICLLVVCGEYACPVRYTGGDLYLDGAATKIKRALVARPSLIFMHYADW
jgi:hypothetical protein